ncbi:unnamed protein product [Owenia fusiformis]|uniref:PCNA-interacting partner n=1 Tax=Owenia fusiformis TaxID=6347 RepID=A0A8J1Y166_OWEFU|nr:unnamed protein product [Owenia fusiformis]
MASVYMLSGEYQDQIEHIHKQLQHKLVGNHVLIGSHSQNIGCLNVKTITEVYLQLHNQYKLYRNERETMLNQEDQLIIVQLCMAERNKKEFGSFEVDVSAVLEAHTKLTKHMLNPTEYELSDDLRPVSDLYASFMKECNMLDWYTLFSRVKKAMESDEKLKENLASMSVLACGIPRSEIEKAMFLHLCTDKACEAVEVETPLDGSASDVKVNLLPTSLIEGLEKDVNANSATHPQSVTEIYATSVFLAYIHLLVNSRSELSLARAVNVPDRGIDHAAFTDLKRVSKQKNMPMYQTAASYIMRIRLGGKSYAPDVNCPLRNHVKGLGEFTDFLHKLQCIVEENPNTSAAVRKVINNIKIVILKSRDTGLRAVSVENVANWLMKVAQDLIDETLSKTDGSSPSRAVSEGGSTVGRKTLNILRFIINQASSQPDTSNHVSLLTDHFSSQKTPVRFPSLMSKFRSPEADAESPEHAENKSLLDRAVSNVLSGSCDEKAQGLPRFKSCMDWAKPLHDVGIRSTTGDDIYPLQSDTFIQCKTVVHSGDNSSMSKKAKRVLESLHDQENQETSTENAITEKTNNDATASSVNNINKDNGAPIRSKSNNAGKSDNAGKGKRKLPASSSQPAKKVKKSATSKSSKLKDKPLLKGQQVMTQFFRL